MCCLVLRGSLLVSYAALLLAMELRLGDEAQDVHWLKDGCFVHLVVLFELTL